jgi:hypothetical protein
MAESTLSKIQGQGGILKTSQEELQGLAGAAGLVAPPTDAINAASIGANADQAKMAGTGQQMQAAVKLALKPEDTLAYKERTESGRTKAADARELPETLKQLVGLGGKIGAATQTAIQSAGEKALLNASNINEEALKGTFPDTTKATEVKNAAIAYAQAEPKDKLAKLTALTSSAGSLANAAKVFGVDEATWTKQIADALPADLTLKEIASSGLTAIDTSGITSFLAEGDPNLDSAKVESMSWGEIKARTSKKLQDRYMDVNQLTKQANDLTLDRNTREAAQARLRELGAGGVVTASEQAQDLTTAIERGDNITFNGKEMEIGEFLDDEDTQAALKGILTGAVSLDSIKNTPYASLIPMVSQYKNELAAKYGIEIAGGVQSELEKNSGSVKANSDATKSELGKLGITDPNAMSKEMKTLFGITDGMINGTEAFVANPQLQRLQSMFGSDPAAMSEVMQFLTKNPTVSADFMSKYGSDANKLKSAMKSYETGQGVFSTFFKDVDGSGKVDATDITSNLAETFGLDASQLASLDFEDYGITLPEFLDSNKDGKLDPSADIATRMGSMGVDGKIGLANQGLPSGFATTIQGALGELSSAKTNMQAISSAPPESVIHKIAKLGIPSGSTNYSDFNSALNAASSFLNNAQKEQDGINAEISRLTADMAGKSPAVKAEYQKAIDSLKMRNDEINKSKGLATITRERVMKANQAIAKLPNITKKEDLRKLAKTNPDALATEMAAHLREKAIAKVGPQPNAKVGSKTYNAWWYKIQQAEKKIKSSDFERAFQEQFGARMAAADREARQAAILRDTDAYLKAERNKYRISIGGGTADRNTAGEKGPGLSGEGQRSLREIVRESIKGWGGQ